LRSQLLAAALLPLLLAICLRDHGITLLGVDDLRLAFANHLGLRLLSLAIPGGIESPTGDFDPVAEGGGVDGSGCFVALMTHIGHGYFVHWNNAPVSLSCLETFRRARWLREVRRVALVASRGIHVVTTLGRLALLGTFRYLLLLEAAFQMAGLIRILLVLLLVALAVQVLRVVVRALRHGGVAVG